MWPVAALNGVCRVIHALEKCILGRRNDGLVVGSGSAGASSAWWSSWGSGCWRWWFIRCPGGERKARDGDAGNEVSATQCGCCQASDTGLSRRGHCGSNGCAHGECACNECACERWQRGYRDARRYCKCSNHCSCLGCGNGRRYLRRPSP